MGEETSIRCRLDELLEARGMTLTKLSELVGGEHREPLGAEERPGPRHPLFHARSDLSGARL